MDPLQLVITVTGLLLSALGTYVTTSGFYKKQRREDMQRFADSQTKEYAAQRDFEHLKRNYQQLQESLGYLTKEIHERQEKLDDRFNRMERITTALWAKVSDGSISDILGSHRPE